MSGSENRFPFKDCFILGNRQKIPVAHSADYGRYSKSKIPLWSINSITPTIESDWQIQPHVTSFLRSIMNDNLARIFPELHSSFQKCTTNDRYYLKYIYKAFCLI